MVKFLYTAEDKTQRNRVIAITVAAAVLILGLSVWAIIAIVTAGDVKEVTVEPVINPTDGGMISEVIEVPATPSQPAPSQPTTNQVDTPITGTVPETGPLEAIPVALLLGSLVAYIGSCILVERNKR